MPSRKSKGRVIVGLSGGVDSSVAALLLKQQGWQVEGLFMKNWEEDDSAEYCSAAEDLADAQAVAARLDIPLHTMNFATEYWDGVFEHFLAEYRAGRTPNPDVLCNREIKFKAFLDHALELGARHIATGHYAASDCVDGRYRLLRSADENKDQTYFLYMLGQRPLAHALFPLGQLHKGRVRELAEQAGFPNHKKKDSTGICFIGERKFRDFLSRYLEPNPGPIATPDGQVIGEHQGLMYYTLGQRQGLGIGGVQGHDETPWFAAKKDLTNNRLIAVQGHDHPLLMCRTAVIEQLHWVAEQPPAEASLRCQTRYRHRQALQGCRLVRQDDGTCTVQFDQPQRAVSPGQSMVFYQQQECLGGGVIRETDQA